MLSLVFLAGAAQFLLCWDNSAFASASSTSNASDSNNANAAAKVSAVAGLKNTNAVVPHTFQQQTTLAPSDLGSGDKFGFAVGLSEDFNTALVAAEGQNSLTGAAYIYLRDANGSWRQQQKLTAQDGAANDSFGCWMALSGDGTTAIIGAYTKNQSIGAAYVFARDVNGNWSQQQKLTASDGAAGDSFGGWVAIARDGNTVLVSASHKNNYAGAAYVFTRTNNTVWSQQQKLVSQDITPSDNFGSWLGLSGDGTTALIGAFTKNTNVGAAYIFALNGSTWTQQQKLTASDPLQGSDFSFAATLSRDGNTAILGAATQNEQTGAAYIFIRNGSGTWTQQQKLVPADVGHNDYFGFAVSLSGSGDVALISAKGKNSNSGAAYTFSRSNGSWTQQQEITEQNAQPNDEFGISLALNRDGNIALIGADHSNSAKGVAYIFGQAPAFSRLSLVAPVTTQVSTPFTVTVQALDQFGNLSTGYTGAVHFTSTDSAAVLPADYTFTVADGGVHSFTNAVTLNTVGNQTLKVEDKGNPTINSSTGIAVVSGPVAASFVYNLPFLAFKAGGFTSYLAFQNASATTANVLVQYYKADGSTLAAAPLAGSCTSLAGRSECLPSNPFDLGDSGSGVIVSSQPLAVIVAEGTPYGGSAYGVSQGSSDTLIAPIILHNAYSDFSTQLTLFNGGSSSVAATAQFYDQNGSLQGAATQTVNLAPHSSKVFDQSASNSNLPNSFKGWARITSAAGSQLVSQVLEQSPGQHFVAIANAQPKAIPTLYAPAIFRGAFNFTTGFNLVNPGSAAVNATVTYYDDNGTAYAATPFNIGPNSVVAVFQGDSSGTGLPGNGGLPRNFSGAAIVTSTGGDGLVMVINEGGGVTSAGTSLSGVYAAAGNGSSSVSLPVMANGGFGYRTGATIFNTSDQAVAGTIQYYDVSGNTVLAPQPFNIGPHASKLAYQGDPNLLPNDFYGTAVVTQTSGGGSSGLIVTTNALSGLFYTYTQPN